MDPCDALLAQIDVFKSQVAALQATLGLPAVSAEKKEHSSGAFTRGIPTNT